MQNSLCYLNYAIFMLLCYSKYANFMLLFYLCYFNVIMLFYLCYFNIIILFYLCYFSVTEIMLIFMLCLFNSFCSLRKPDFRQHSLTKKKYIDRDAIASRHNGGPTEGPL